MWHVYTGSMLLLLAASGAAAVVPVPVGRSFPAAAATHGVLQPLVSRKRGGQASAADLLAPAASGNPSTYPCYQATCAGNASCCHYGGADMCCWNGSPGGVPGPVGWHCGGVAFGMHPKGLCCREF
jgi:hypothetical protein